MFKGQTPVLTGLSPVLTTQTQPPALMLNETPKKKKCACCSHRLQITDMACGRCSQKYCSLHRMPEDHNCPHDYKTAARAHLIAANPVIRADKMNNRI